MPEKPCAAAAERNAPAILEVLRHELPRRGDVLEIGSGTGQHAVLFARELAHLQWQTSDLDENHGGIRAWVTEAALDNVREPLSLDIGTAELAEAAWDAVYSCNTAHIMSFAAVIRMFQQVGKTLRPRGVFCLYGPFRVSGRFNTPSNAEFDSSLRDRDPSMGIRDLEDLDALGYKQGLKRHGLYAMPANNLVVVWKKTGNGNW